jgi:hypothetical protein
MLCGLPTVQQAAIGDCLSFDPFSFNQNGLAPSEVDVGWRQIADALVIAQVIVVNDEGLDLGFETVVIFDWKSDVAARPANQALYAGQLAQYLNVLEVSTGPLCI